MVLNEIMSIIDQRISCWKVLTTYKNNKFDKMNVKSGIIGYRQRIIEILFQLEKKT